ncbi:MULTISPECIES: replicative DNA helicase [Providencia]|uniref:replicative DNA helicase n=1 Tax=Providencia TaxID=586 RepID=UPI0014075096|nr:MULTISPECIES: DnaB-like helicase C-terminal domain-containing protein [Providencia]ELQ1454791.1 AAA family ATPase [Providencia rettgeri]ELR5186605.1 AAA family ATPase [Providencia rettgeri]EMB0751164.1 AAA family ATPase [Providencia rettgeri]MDI7238185.1 DnaB-like helicase C-terminal domain-containing protein [Providencia huaxiensis]HEC8322443.1 AAA family ATPase [Providencia rettgeri]
MTNNIFAPPNSAEAEQAVLGGLMISTDEDKRQRVISLIKPESFYQWAHNRIFSEIVRLIKNNQPTDVITVSDALTANGDLDKVGGFAYVAELCMLPTAANIVNYARIIRDKAIQRYAINNLNTCVEMLMANDGLEVNHKLANVQQVVSSIIEHAKTGKSKGLRPARDVVGDWVEEVERRFDDPTNAAGFTLGIESLDDLMAPKQALRGSLIVVGARPKMGKTAFYNRVATHFALNHRLPTLLFSLEMTDRGIIERMIAQEGGVSADIFYTGAHDDMEMARALARAEEIAESNMYIDSTPGVDLHHIIAECRKVKRVKEKIGLIAVDYLTLIKAAPAERRDIAYGDITTGLKNLAKEMDCVVLLLTQLNRKLEERADKRPTPADSRDTGQIEQDCDVWIGLYRDAVYNNNADKSLMEIILRLNRDGNTGTAHGQLVNSYIKNISQSEAERLSMKGQESKRNYSQKVTQATEAF